MSLDPEQTKRLLATYEASKRSLISADHAARLSESIKSIQDTVSLQARSLTQISEQLRKSFVPLGIQADFCGVAEVLKKQTSVGNLVQSVTIGAGLLKDLQAQSAQWRATINSFQQSALRLRLPESSASQLARSTLAWDAGLSETLKKLALTGLTSSRGDLCQRLLGPAHVLSRFAEETLTLAWQTKHCPTLKALNASLVLADAQHLANLDVLSDFAANPEDYEAPSAARVLDAPFVQRKELLDLPELEDEEDVERLVEQSRAAATTEQSRAVLALATRCNNASQVRASVEIFKPTTKVLVTFTDLPWLIPQDESTFGEFVDCLYFLLYEGAGKDKLRFLKAHGGPLDAEACEVIWCIKTLRNKWLRHDADHGKEADIKKSWNSLGTQLKWLGIDGYPRSIEDYRTLHRRLLDEVRQFLESLFKSI